MAYELLALALLVGLAVGSVTRTRWAVVWPFLATAVVLVPEVVKAVGRSDEPCIEVCGAEGVFDAGFPLVLLSVAWVLGCLAGPGGRRFARASGA